MEKRLKKKTTITIFPNQKDFIDEFRRRKNGWNLSKFIQEKLDELMHQDSKQLKKIIDQKKKDKQRINKELEQQINDLKKQYSEVSEKEERIKKQNDNAFIKRRNDYGR